MLYVSFSVKSLKFAPKWSLSNFYPFLAVIFVTIATVKVKLIPDIYTWANVLINLYKENGENHFYPHRGGGQK